MHRLLTVAAVCGATLAGARGLSAQRTADSLSLSLGEAVTLALRVGDEARAAAAQIEVADAQLLSARATALPQLRLNGTYTHVFENARANAVGQIFNQPNSYNINANLSQSLFQGGRIRAGMAAAREIRQAARLTASEVQAQLSLDVQRAYLDALLADRVVSIRTANLALADSRSREIELLQTAGRAARFDVLRVRVERANLEPAVIQARSARELAMLELKGLLNVPAEQPIRLTTQLDARHVESLVATVANDSVPVADRPAVRAAELTLRARRNGISIARADLLPTVSIFVQSGYQAFPLSNSFPNGFGRLVPTSCPTGSPADRVCTVQNGGFFADRTLGIQTSWPLFDGLRAKGNIDLAQAQTELARIQLAQQREAIAIEVARAKAELARSRALYQASRQNAGEADEAFRLASLRFTRGISTQLEVSDAQLALLTAQTNEAEATYSLYLASAELARALGRPVPLPPGAFVPIRTTSTTPARATVSEP